MSFNFVLSLQRMRTLVVMKTKVNMTFYFERMKAGISERKEER